MDTKTETRQLSDLTVALFDNDDYFISLFKSIAASLGMQKIGTFGSTKSAVSKIRMAGAPDILFIRYKSPTDSVDELCGLIRTRDTFPFPYLPMVAIMDRATVSSVTAVRDAGVDEFLGTPFSPATLALRINAILFDRRGFVDVPGYFGPDRRRGSMAEWLGADRRSGSSELIDPVTQATYIG